MNQHSPGPWLAIGTRVSDASGDPVCDVLHSPVHNGAKFDANRDLIAAAPVMYAALVAAAGGDLSQIPVAIRNAEGR